MGVKTILQALKNRFDGNQFIVQENPDGSISFGSANTYDTSELSDSFGQLSAAQIASPTAAQLANFQALYQLNVVPYTLYQSNGTALVTVGGGSTINFADAEVPGGAQNNSNKVFTLTNTPNPAASLELFFNGVLLDAGGDDYTLATGTITLVTLTPNSAATPADVLKAFYRY